MTRIIYLHGFASSPQSNKAQFFGRKFAAAGIPFEVPQLDEGNFAKLTVTSQLKVIGQAVEQAVKRNESVVLMGSSLGGYLAALYADLYPREIHELILMAPAFEFPERLRARYTAQQLEDWKTRGWAPVFHYGSKQEERLGYQFLEDAARHASTPDFHQRALLLHGTEDQVVPSELSYAFARDHAHTRLALFPSGHELTDVLDDLWREVSLFLKLL